MLRFRPGPARLGAARLRDLNRRFALQSADATNRFLDALAYLARTSSAKNDPLALLPLELPQLVGLERDTASRALSKLRTRGTVEDDNGRLRLAYLALLQKRGLLT